MSKSDFSEQSRINLSDSKEIIINKIKKAKTDSSALPSSKEELKSRPEAENLLGIYCSLSGEKIEETIKIFKGKNFSFLKDKLSDLIIEKICPIGEEIKRLMNDENHLISILKLGSEKANLVASRKLKKIYEKVGFLDLN